MEKSYWKYQLVKMCFLKLLLVQTNGKNLYSRIENKSVFHILHKIEDVD